MKKIIFLISIISWSVSLLAQTTISGNVKEKGGDAIIGANVFLENSFDGASTDLEGNFTFTTTQTGQINILVSYLGYKEYRESIHLSGQPLELQILLRPEASTLQEVTITAGSFEAGDEKKSVVLNSIDIATTAGANADISAAMNTLPGTQRVGESGQLFVRGGAASETRTYMDGMYVQSPYNSTTSNLPARGRFSPFLFKGTTFSTGGYSAEYGQALSSALLLNTQDLATETISSVSLMTVGGGLAHTQAWENTSLAVGFDYTNLAPYNKLMPANLNFEKPFEGKNGQIIFRHKTSETGLLKVFANVANNQFALEIPDRIDVNKNTLLSMNNNNYFGQISYQEVLSDRWSLFVASGVSRNDDWIDAAFNLEKKEYAIQSKTRLTYDWNDHVVLKMGGEFIHSNWEEQFTDENEQVFNSQVKENFSAAFTEADIYFTRKLVARAGIRAERSNFLGENNLAPRFSIAYQLGKNEQISLAAGQFYQTPENELLRYHNQVNFERANHYILNYQIEKNQRTFRAELYHKDYDNLVKFDPTKPWISNNEGRGYARGLDIFYRDKKTINQGDFWISYSYLDTERDYQDFPYAATPHFASKHNLSAVYKHFIADMNSVLGVTYAYGSSRPYFNPNHENFHSDLLPEFHDLSVNWSYLTNLFGQFTVLHLSAANILGLENTFGYQYSQIPNESGQYDRVATRPTNNSFFFIGLFVSIGKRMELTKDTM
ncbi:MAG: carboxypeptidase-like regulatory domain-containing protein [Bacteroidota bacterium]